MNPNDVDRRTLRETVTTFDVELEALEVSLATIQQRERTVPDWWRIVNHRLTTFFECWRAFKAKCDAINLEAVQANWKTPDTQGDTPPVVAEVDATPPVETERSPHVRPAGRMDPTLG